MSNDIPLEKQDELIAEFISILSGNSNEVDYDFALDILKNSNFNIEDALNLILPNTSNPPTEANVDDFILPTTTNFSEGDYVPDDRFNQDDHFLFPEDVLPRKMSPRDQVDDSMIQSMINNTLDNTLHDNHSPDIYTTDNYTTDNYTTDNYTTDNHSIQKDDIELKKTRLNSINKESINTIGFIIKLPNGNKVQIDLPRESPIQLIYDYIDVYLYDNGIDPFGNYTLVSNHPRVVYNDREMEIGAVISDRKIVLFVEVSS